MPQSDLLLDEDHTTLVNRLELTTGPEKSPDIVLWPKWATLDLGGGAGSNSDGDIKLKTRDDKPRVHLDAGGGGPKNPSENRIYLDGSTSQAILSATDGTNRVTLDGQTGQVGVSTADGADTLRIDGESGMVGFASRGYQYDSRYSTPMLSMFEGEQQYLQREPVVPVVAYSSHLPRHGLVFDDKRDTFLFQGDPPEPEPPDVSDEVTEVGTDVQDIDSGEPVEEVEDTPQGGFDFQTISPTLSTSTDGGTTDGTELTDGGATQSGTADGSGDANDGSDPAPVLSVNLQDERVGVGTDEPETALDVDGKVTARTVTETSDARCKENVTPITDAVETVTSLDGVSYEWTDEFAPEDDGRHLGFLASEVASVLPSVVDDDGDGVRTMTPTDLIAVLVEAVKDQQADLEAKERRIDEQADRLDRQSERLDRQRERLEALEAQVTGTEDER